MALCSQVFSHTFHFSSGTHNKLWLDFVKGTQSIYADRCCVACVELIGGGIAFATAPPFFL